MNAPAEFSRPVLRALRAEIDAALAAIGAKHGITLTAGNASFTPARFTMKLEGALNGAPTRAAETLAALGQFVGVDPTWIGKQVRYSGKVFTLDGMKAGGRSVLLSRQPDGKVFRASVADFVRSARLVDAAPDALPLRALGLTDAHKEEFRRLACALSPENLHCDGEISNAEAQRRAVALRRQWREVELRAGVKVSESDVWSWK